jgi:hypothetical protein
MAYSDFTLETAVERLGLTILPEDLFPALAPQAPPGWLVELLARGHTLPQTTEKARSELIVVPILLAARELTAGDCTIHSGPTFNVDPAQGLTGECDFILSRGPSLPIVQAPVVTLVEAKRGDIELGLGQCAAQMVAARIFNERHGQADRRVYGCVTSGTEWQFLRLSRNQLSYDPTRRFLPDLGLILAIFDRMLS